MKKLKALLGIGNNEALNNTIVEVPSLTTTNEKNKLLGQTIQEDIIHEIVQAIGFKESTVTLVSSVSMSKEKNEQDADDIPTGKMVYGIKVIVNEELILNYPIYEDHDAFFVSNMASRRRLLNLSLVQHIALYVKDFLLNEPMLKNPTIELKDEFDVSERLFGLDSKEGVFGEKDR